MIIFIQIAKWFWSLFPALIGIMGPTGAYNKQNNLDLQASQLVANSDLTIDSDNNDIPDGFTYSGTITIKSLNNGIVNFTPGNQYTSIARPSNNDTIIGNTYYTYARVKSLSNKSILNTYNPATVSPHTGSGLFELLSTISTKTSTDNRIDVGTNLIADWTPIEVDYVGTINLTAVFGNDIPDKQVLDDFILSGERFLFTDDATSDSWFNTGFTGESRDILDILGYFFWLAMPVIAIYWVFRLLLRII